MEMVMVKIIKKIPNNDDAGILTLGRLKETPGFPKDADYDKGLIAVIECDQDIPCNPCEDVCLHGAIKVGSPITNLPELNPSFCNGCLKCLAICPGLCIFAINKNYDDKNALIYLPYEYSPLPVKGSKIRALDRRGEFVCSGTVHRLLKSSKKQNSTIAGILVPKEYFNTVRHFEFEF
jgi:Fe-S-cluster-containing hydrogenase component 2